MEKGLLHVDASVLQRGHGAPVMKPPQLHRRVQVGGGALQREAVPTEDQLPLGGDELEEGQLQRSVCNRTGGHRGQWGQNLILAEEKGGGGGGVLLFLRG